MRTCLAILFDGRAGLFIIIDPERLLSLYSIVFQDVTLFNNTVTGTEGNGQHLPAYGRDAACDRAVEISVEN